MKNVLFLALFTFSSLLVGQQFDVAHLYPIEASHSFIQFEATYMGYAKVKGNFGDFYGSIYYNPDAPAQTSVTFQIEVESIDTNNDWRDGDLKSGNWFLVEEFPHIHFTSTAVREVEDGLAVTGDLTIKDVTQRISFTMPPPLGVIHDIRGDDQVIFTGEHTINRKEYGVMGKNWSQIKEGIAALSDDITIEFSLLGKQYNPDNFSNFLRNPKSPPGGVWAAYKTDGVDAALAHYEQLRADTSVQVNHHALNMVAYMLSMQEADEDAKKLLDINVAHFPEEGAVYNSMGRWYALRGQMQKAATQYRKALELDPRNMNAAEVLKHLGG